MAVARMLVAGRYRLLEPVGAGGMGRVWLARDEVLHRDVAVKEFMPPDWMTDEEKARLKDRTLREARSAARLNHPHVVQIYDVVHADGLPWIVMEYVPSRSLYQVITDDGPYSPEATARMGLDVLDALTAAHRAGVLHRDVKPHNVLIGDGGRVVLTDFGLATMVDDGAVTGPGLVVGSPQYVSPERARDGASTVESDLWSFGATIYAAVEGRSPYARESAMSTLMALATDLPDPPERAGMLTPVLIGLLRHDPAARLTATEVERRLRMIVAAAAATRTPSTKSASGKSTPLKGTSSTAPAPGLPSPRRARVAVSPDAEIERGNKPPSTAGDAAKVPALRRGNQTVMRALPAQRISAGPVSPAPSVRATSPVPPVKRRSRSTLAVAGITLLLVLGGGGLLAGYLIQRDDGHRAAVAPSVTDRSALISPSPKAVDPGGFSPIVCNGAAPAGAPTAPQRGAAVVNDGWQVLAGWSLFNSGNGFQVAVPDGWTYQRIGTEFCFRDNRSQRVLSIDFGRKPSADPVQACRKEAARLIEAGALPGYQQLRIQSTPLVYKAADWEYLYRAPSGALMHAQTRWFAKAGKAYAISWATLQIDWNDNQAKLDMLLTTFHAGQKPPD